MANENMLMWIICAAKVILQVMFTCLTAAMTFCPFLVFLLFNWTWNSIYGSTKFDDLFEMFYLLRKSAHIS